MASIGPQDLRRRLYGKAKAEKPRRFWGLHVHVAKRETLRAAYAVAKKNNGAPGRDGVTFEAIEVAGVEAFLGQLRDELVSRTYRPLRTSGATRDRSPCRRGRAIVPRLPLLRRLNEALEGVSPKLKLT
jgi:RNA-directed DNA polymerase